MKSLSVKIIFILINAVLGIRTIVFSQQSMGDSLVAIANKHYTERAYRLAIPFERAALEYFMKSNDSLRMSSSLNDIGLYHFLLGDYDSSLVYYKKSLTIDKQLKQFRRIISRYKNLGITYRNMGEYVPAIKYYRQALTLSEEHGIEKEKASLNNVLGNLLISQRRPKEALIYFKQARSSFLQRGDTSNYGRVFNNIGNAFFQLIEYDSALKYYDEALNFKRKYNNSADLGSSLSNIGQVLMKMQIYDSASYFLMKAYHWKEQEDNPRNLAHTTIDLAELSLLKSDLTNASKYLEISRDNISNLMDRNLLAQYYLLRSQLLDALQRPMEAYEYYRKWNTLQDSLYQVERIEVLSQLAEYEKDIVISEKEIAEKELRLSRNQTEQQKLISFYQWGAIIFISMLAIVIGVLGYRSREQRNHIQFLLRGFHHGINNHLQIISALLETQANLSEDEIANSLRDVQRRIEAVIGIYRRLYLANEFQYVDQQSYLEELVDNTAFVFNKRDALQKRVTTMVENIDAEKSIMMGLIINEVLTNAFKYGLKDMSNPFVEINLIRHGELYDLRVSDNGQSTTLPTLSDQSFGMQLIHSFTKKLQAEHKFYIDQGMHFEMSFRTS